VQLYSKLFGFAISKLEKFKRKALQRMGKLLPMLVLAAHLGLSSSAAEHEEHPGGRKLPPSLESHRQEPSANLRAVPRRGFHRHQSHFAIRAI